MSKPKVPMPRKTSGLDIAIYAVISVIVIYFCLAFGAAMDYSKSADNRIDTNKLEKNVSMVLSEPSLIGNVFKLKDSYTPKMLFVGICGTGITVLYQASKEKKRFHRKGTEHGSAKWGDKKEMKNLADKENKKEFKTLRSDDGSRVFDEKGNFVGVIIDNNILLTQEVYLSLNAHQHLLNLNVLVIGGAGSGKTRFFAKPNILQLNTSYVVTDPKGEILRSVGKVLKQAGYKLKVLNLIEMQHSNNYNPFAYVYDHNGNLSEDYIKKMINVLFKNTKGDGEKEDFWSQKGQSLLEAITFLLFEESEYNAEFDENGRIIPETRDLSHLNFASATAKMRKLMYPPHGSQIPDGFFIEKNPEESDEEFEKRRNAAFLCPLDKDFLELEKRKKDTLAMRLYKEVRNAPEETGQSFLSSANVKTFMFNLENIMSLTCCDNIHIETMGDEKTALFILTSATDSTYNFLAAMMYTQMFDVLANRANFKYGGVLPVHVRCIMDEFANIGEIPDFDKVIAFVRSMGISLNIILQNMAQLKARYEKNHEVITGNCDSILFLGGKEESTLKYISEALGKETIDIQSFNKTGGKQPSTSENNSIIGRELMQPNEIATMPISDCILMIRSHNPFYCTKYPLDKHPNFKFTDDFSKDNAFDVHSVRTVAFEEFKKQCQKVDTYINPEKDTRSEKIEILFQKSDKPENVSFETLTFESYEEAEMYADTNFEDNIEEYFGNKTELNKTEFGENSDLQQFDLGEPIEETTQREGVNDDEDESSVMVSVGQQYIESDDKIESLDDLNSQTISNSILDVTEIFNDSVAEIPDENDFGLFDD